MPRRDPSRVVAVCSRCFAPLVELLEGLKVCPECGQSEEACPLCGSPVERKRPGWHRCSNESCKLRPVFFVTLRLEDPPAEGGG